MIKTCLGVALIAGALVVLPRVGSAQDVVVEGPGHEISPGTVIHPAVGIETGVDSNVFYEESTPAVAPIIRLLLSFDLASQDNKPQDEASLAIPDDDAEPISPPTLTWRLGGLVAAEQYLSGNDRVTDASNIGGQLKFTLTAFPEGDVSFDLRDHLTRYTRPQNFESSGNLNRDINRLHLGMRYRPGGGTIQMGFRYENTIDRFEASANSSFANRLQHLLGARADWQILPITRLSLDGSFGFFGTLGDGMLGGVPFKNGSNPLRVQAAIATQLSEPFTFRAHVGYGNGFYSSGQNFSNVLGGLEFGYRYTTYGRFTIAYDYGFQDSLNANFYRDHAVIAKIDQQLGLLLLSISGAARLRAYAGIPPSVGAPNRNDVILDTTVKANYLLRDWLAITGRLEAVTDQTDYMTSAGVPDDPSYTRVEAVAGASAAF